MKKSKFYYPYYILALLLSYCIVGGYSKLVEYLDDYSLWYFNLPIIILGGIVAFFLMKLFIVIIPEKLFHNF